MTCTLCGNTTDFFQEIKKRSYYKCGHCKSVLLHPDHFLTEQAEKERYNAHNDDANDPCYQAYVRPIVEAVQQNFSKSDLGLDYGCGKSAIVQKLLAQDQYKVAGYDPYYFASAEVLKATYNYITCCEVVEHFYQPAQEFLKLYRLLGEGGKLFIKTKLLTSSIVFKDWWYKNDATHVFFYSPETFKFIKNKFGFSAVFIHKDHIVLTK